MIIKWKQDIELQITTDFNEENDEAITENQTFRAGEINDVDILERTEPYKIFQKGKPFVDMQFNCGDVAYGVPSVLYEIIEP